jgi:hypothetical protein
MKPIAFAILFSVASVCSAAIEFSEDVPVDAAIAAETNETEKPAKPKPAEQASRLPQLVPAGLPATSRPVDPAVMASNAAVTTAQSSGGLRIGTTNSVAMLGMMSGGGGTRGNREANDSDDLLSDVEATTDAEPGAKPEGSDEESPEGGSPKAEALPEPATFGVWAVLTVCGIALLRRRK